MFNAIRIYACLPVIILRQKKYRYDLQKTINGDQAIA